MRWSVPKKQHPLARVTFNDGLQIGLTWSPDGRFIAYSSDLTTAENSTTGCSKLAAAIRFRSRRDRDKTGNPTGHRMGSTLRIVPKTATAACSLYPAWWLRAGTNDRLVRLLPTVVSGQLADLVPYTFCWRSLRQFHFTRKPRTVVSRLAPRRKKNLADGGGPWTHRRLLDCTGGGGRCRQVADRPGGREAD
jgi:hypothetical protein